MKPPTQRQLRAGELVRHALMEIFAREELEDPALAGVSVTVTEVRMSPDLKHAAAFCAPLGGEDMQKVVTALNRAQGFLRGRLARTIDLRFTPTLKFIADQTFEEAARIGRLLNTPRVRQDLDREDAERSPDDGVDGDA
jgi:ribosome-binding factor A